MLEPFEKLDRLIEVDLKGTIYCCWRVAPLMKAAGSGVILNNSWDLALFGMEGQNPEMFAAVLTLLVIAAVFLLWKQHTLKEPEGAKIAIAGEVQAQRP